MSELHSRFIKNANLTKLRGQPMESGVLCVTSMASRQGSKSVQDVWVAADGLSAQCAANSPFMMLITWTVGSESRQPGNLPAYFIYSC